eukprot:gene5560-11189_t
MATMGLFQFCFILIFARLANILRAQPFSSSDCYDVSSDSKKFYEFSPLVNSSWNLLKSAGNQKWSARNGHAVCVFNGLIWLTGGRADSSLLYNLQPSVTKADVWYSSDGDKWTQVKNLRGDFYAQNDDALQPGPTAPWFGRYGHTLTAINVMTNGIPKEIMVLTGGFAPDAMNDVWASENGGEWVFVHYAPWNPRGYHAVTIFNGTMWLMGGSPLNNDIWRMKNISRVDRTREPLTRAMFTNYTYHIEWERLPEPPWSPRAGLGVVTHWYHAVDFPHSGVNERILVVGGYGGWPKNELEEYKGRVFDGIRCQPDVWEYSVNVTGNRTMINATLSYGGYGWRLLNANAAFGGRAWFGLTVWHGRTPLDDVTTSANSKNLRPRIWMVGGGYLGADGPSRGSREVRVVEGRVDSYWTRDGVTWTRVNRQYGGIGQQLSLWSSSDWSCFKISAKTHVFRGLWGHSLITFNTSVGREMFLLGGTSDTADGAVLNRIWKANYHMLCFIEGKECGGIGQCSAEGGCMRCTGDDYCQQGQSIHTTSSARYSVMFDTQYVTMLWMLSTVIVLLIWVVVKICLSFGHLSSISIASFGKFRSFLVSNSFQ